MKIKLSIQSLNALMIAIQNALDNQSDLSVSLLEWDWSILAPDGKPLGLGDEATEEELEEVYQLWVNNPPVFEIEKEMSELEVETNA